MKKLRIGLAPKSQEPGIVTKLIRAGVCDLVIFGVENEAHAMDWSYVTKTPLVYVLAKEEIRIWSVRNAYTQRFGNEKLKELSTTSIFIQKGLVGFVIADSREAVEKFLREEGHQLVDLAG